MTKAEKYMAIATNNVAIAENVPKVYAAGQKSMVDESKIVPKTASGSYISVDDVSEIPHSVACKVESANLWRGNNGYSVVGNGTVQAIYQDSSLKGQSCPMTVSCEVMSENLEYTENGNLVYLHVMYEDGTTNILTLCGTAAMSGKFAKQFNEAGAKVIKQISVFAHNRFTGGTVTLSNIMLNRGTTALPYTPCVEPEAVKVTRTGENLLGGEAFAEKLFNSVGNSTIDREKRTVTLKGGSGLSAFVWWDNFEPNTQYTVIIKSKDLYNIVHKSTNLAFHYTDGTYTTLLKSEETTEIVSFTSVKGKSLKKICGSNYGGYIEFEYDYVGLFKGVLTPEDFEPYNGQTLTPKADGTVEGMTSVSPYMNIFTDNAGATLEATYRRSWGMQTERERFYNDFQQGKINVSISFEWLALDKANTTSVVNALSATTTGQTLTLKLSAVNTAFETSSGAADGSTSTEFAALVATKSNWTIVLK